MTKFWVLEPRNPRLILLLISRDSSGTTLRSHSRTRQFWFYIYLLVYLFSLIPSLHVLIPIHFFHSLFSSNPLSIFPSPSSATISLFLPSTLSHLSYCRQFLIPPSSPLQLHRLYSIPLPILLNALFSESSGWASMWLAGLVLRVMSRYVRARWAEEIRVNPLVVWFQRK